ncbi:MAG: UbiD family decarboxylase [Chloroflexi bacterium]|nr:UbiD family decarboxylase [Chloroflexota bacterium]
MDLRSFLKEYEARYPEDVLHIEKEISGNQEITALVIQLQKQQKFPVLVFHNVLNPTGKKSSHPVITNVLASRVRQARLCGCTVEGLGRHVYEATLSRRVAPVAVPKTDAPVREVIKTADDIDLFHFPLIWHNALDAGYYLSAGFFTSYEPESGIDNCALLRTWIKEKDTVRVFLVPRPMHSAWNLHKHEQKGQDMKACIWLGHHPLAYMGGLAKLAYPESHWEAIGGMMGEPLRLVSSESLGDDFKVPADAEVVIEGIMEANRRYPEGPFGENPGYYGGQILNPQLRVTAVTHRKDAMWYNIAAGYADHQQSGAPNVEGQLWAALKPRFATLVNVHVPLSATGRYAAYLQFKNPLPGEARLAIMLACTARTHIKHVFAFDEDVDIFDERDVMWAITTRSQWDRDVMIFPHTKSVPLDPSTTPPALGATGGIDCTKPWGEPYEERVGIEQEVAARVKLEDYVSPEDLGRLTQDRSRLVRSPGASSNGGNHAGLPLR